MKLTKEDAVVLWYALTVGEHLNSQGHPMPRLFPLNQQKDAASVAKKITDNLTDDKKNFVDGEAELTTDEKKLLLDCLKREWTAVDGGKALELSERLNSEK